MGRRMRPLNPAWGPVERFACELRALRAAAGEMPFRRMARLCAVPKSALAEAVAGHQLPPEPMLRAFVEVCGGDWPWWRDRWMGARAEAAADAELAEEVNAAEDGRGWLVPKYPSPLEPVERRSVHVPAVRVDPSAPRAGRRRLWSAVAVGVAGVAAFGAGWVLRPLMDQAEPGEPSARASTEVAAEATPRTAEPADGVDPYISGCGRDQQLIETRRMQWPDKSPYGALELFHSHRCNANWGYVSGPNSKSWKVHIIVHRPDDGARVPVIESADVSPGSWSGMLLTSGGCVYIEAYVETVTGPARAVRTSCYKESDAVLHS
jgi:hypothetical protein